MFSDFEYKIFFHLLPSCLCCLTPENLVVVEYLRIGFYLCGVWIKYLSRAFPVPACVLESCNTMVSRSEWMGFRSLHLLPSFSEGHNASVAKSWALEPNCLHCWFPAPFLPSWMSLGTSFSASLCHLWNGDSAIPHHIAVVRLPWIHICQVQARGEPWVCVYHSSSSVSDWKYASRRNYSWITSFLLQTITLVCLLLNIIHILQEWGWLCEKWGPWPNPTVSSPLTANTSP